MNAITVAVLITYMLSILSVIGLVFSLLVGVGRSARNFIFLLLSILLYDSLLFSAQFFFTNQSTVSDKLIRASLIFAGLIIPTLYIFLKQKVENFKSRLLFIFGLITAITGVGSAIPFLTTFEFNITKEGIAVRQAGIFYSIQLIAVLGGFLIAVLALHRKQKQLKGNRLAAVKVLKNALTITLLLNIIGAVLSKYIWSQVLTPLSLSLLSLMMYVSIFKHQLFDIRLIIARSMAYLLSTFSLSAIYALIAFIGVSNYLFPENHLSVFQEIVFTLLAVFLALTIQPIRQFFDKISNVLFYRDAYDPERLLDSLNTALVSSIELNDVLNSSSSIIGNSLKADFCVFGIKFAQESNIKLVGTKELSLTDEEIVALQAQLTEINRKTVTPNQEPELDELLSKHSIGLIAKLSTRHGTIGYLFMGDKKSGSPYSNSDTRTMDIIADELAIAIQNSLRFEEIKQFNVTLQSKVDEATGELKVANTRLQELDHIKDEFISIASHQLRTPLTAVKGYLSMVLEGDSGAVSKEVKEMLQTSFDASERMVFLIGDLLNVSRLQSGKFLIQNTPVNLAEVVESEIKQLAEPAKSHGVKLNYKKPADFPVIDLDDMKIRQVIMNFMDNAIYYTPKDGNIDIKLEADDKLVTFTVKDSGIGVPKAEQANLFTKFFRAGNARKARPDGTGLGLFMAKKVIDAQGGQIIFNSEEGKGSTFGFSLPKKVSSEKKAPPDEEKPEAPSPQPVANKNTKSP